MVKLTRTDSKNTDFIALVRRLDAELAERDGSEHAFYAQYNHIEGINQVVVAYEDGTPVGCGAIKPYSPGVMEVKRMFTRPAQRGKGIAARILDELEAWTMELGCSRCILETGRRQPEAIALYTRCGYRIVENYGQYQGVENSVCFQKDLP